MFISKYLGIIIFIICSPPLENVWIRPYTYLRRDTLVYPVRCYYTIINTVESTWADTIRALKSNYTSYLSHILIYNILSYCINVLYNIIIV